MSRRLAGHTEREDGPLIRRAQKGDSEAWAKLVDQWSPYIASLLRACRVPGADESDAFQYVFVELYKALPQLHSPGALAPWIRKTTVRHAIKLRTKAQRLDSLPETDLASNEDFTQNIEQAEQARLVREAVATLKEQCQALIEGLFFADPPRPYAEVAAELGLQLGSLGQIRARCLDALSKALKARGIG